MRHVVVTSAVLVLLNSVSFGEELPRAIKPVISWGGKDSAVSKKSYTRYVSQDKLEQTWRKHKGDYLTCPEIDFNSHMLIAIFNGKGYQDAGMSIAEIVEEKNRIIVRYRVLEYQVGIAEDGMPEPDRRTRSFAFAVLPASTKELIFEIDENNGITVRNKPKWVETGRVPAIPKK